MNWNTFSNWYREDSFVAIFPGGNELRITIGVQAGADEALYRHYANQTFEYIKAHYNTTPRDILSTTTPDADAKADWDRLYARSYMLATLRKVEWREADGEWEETEFPPEWINCENFGKHWPKNVHDLWRNLANTLNPGLYVDALDDDAKNAVRVVAGPLMN